MDRGQGCNTGGGPDSARLASSGGRGEGLQKASHPNLTQENPGGSKRGTPPPARVKASGRLLQPLLSCLAGRGSSAQPPCPEDSEATAGAESGHRSFPRSFRALFLRQPIRGELLPTLFSPPLPSPVRATSVTQLANRLSAVRPLPSPRRGWGGGRRQPSAVQPAGLRSASLSPP